VDPLEEFVDSELAIIIFIPNQPWSYPYNINLTITFIKMQSVKSTLVCVILTDASSLVIVHFTYDVIVPEVNVSVTSGEVEHRRDEPVVVYHEVYQFVVRFQLLEHVTWDTNAICSVYVGCFWQFESPKSGLCLGQDEVRRSMTGVRSASEPWWLPRKLIEWSSVRFVVLIKLQPPRHFCNVLYVDIRQVKANFYLIHAIDILSRIYGSSFN
jgi:hypothetical protein